MSKSEDGVGFASALRAPVQPGMAVEVFESITGAWIPGEAHSGVEGTHRGGRKIHDFPVVWVWVAGVDGPMPWPSEYVRVPPGPAATTAEGGQPNG